MAFETRDRFAARVEAQVRVAGAKDEKLTVTSLSLEGAFVLRAPPCSVATALTLSFADQPAHVPPFGGTVVSQRFGAQPGNEVRFDTLVESQIALLTMRYCRPPSVSGGLTLGFLAKNAPHDRDEFAALHPYPFLVRGDVIRADVAVYAVRNPQVSPEKICPIHLGRDPSSDIFIDDAWVSRHHALFERLEGSVDYVIVDKGSRNGTRIDNVVCPPMSSTKVRFGARVSFGDLPLMFFSAAGLFATLVEAQLVDETKLKGSAEVERASADNT